MTKEKLMEWGLTEEQANKVMEGLNGSFVTKSRFNEVNEENKTLKAQVSERDGQIETLKKSAGDNTELQNQITALQEANKQKDKDHANEIKALKISNAVDVALTNAKAKNNTAVKALLAAFLEKAELADDGTVKGLMLHSVGCSQPNASVFVKNWNRSGLEACVHGFIDGNTGTVYQTLPWNHRGWHAGGAANNTHIGVEMCEPACIKYTGGATFTCSDTATAKAVAKRTYEAAVELFASLCKQYNLDPMKDGVIISHKEGCVRGVASNHGDPEHLWNQLGTGYTMNGFRKAVQAAMKGGGVTTTPSTGNAATGGTGATVKPYLVRVTVSDLYIRKGPGTNYGKNGFIAPGVYTIVAESAGAGATKWGKLKSGAGWISLDYAKTV